MARLQEWEKLRRGIGTFHIPPSRVPTGLNLSNALSSSGFHVMVFRVQHESSGRREACPRLRAEMPQLRRGFRLGFF